MVDVAVTAVGKPWGKGGGVGVDHYVAGGYEAVPGWWAPVEPVLFRAVNTAQRATGDLLEIGAYRGRSAILLGYLSSDDEQLVVCDLFGGSGTSRYSDEENAAWYPGLDVDEFESNYLRFHATLPYVVVGPSTTLREHCEPGTYRMIHIDGSHMYTDVRHDLLLSKELARDSDSVVIIDDIRTAHTPGVWAAAWECVFYEGLVPLLVSGKMYATWGEPTPDFHARLIDAVEREDVKISRHPIKDREVLQVSSHPSVPSTRGRLAQEWIPRAVLRRVAR